MNQFGQQAKDFVRSEQGATAIAAGVITTGAGVALGYFGGKGAIMTACVVGGGLFAVATTFAVAQMGVKAANQGWQAVSRRLEKRPQGRRVDEHGSQAAVG